MNLEESQYIHIMAINIGRTLMLTAKQETTMADTGLTNEKHNNYIETYLPPSIVEKLEAGAFRSLCTHLKERSDEVQNLDLMTISGFCRNCLAKWMVVEARKISKDELDHTQQALNALGYEEAAQYVYGCNYGEWKKRHAKKATDEQMQKYIASTPLHSVFDSEMLLKRGENPTLPPIASTVTHASDEKKTLLSNVCCQDVDDHFNDSIIESDVVAHTTTKVRALPSSTQPQVPSGGITFSIAIITVSDRAFKNEYETGDLSGPAVQRAVTRCLASLNTPMAPVACTFQNITVVPDDMEQIKSKLHECAAAGVDLVLTTGGTGFAARDVTPEATKAVIERECHGLMCFVTSECLKDQPLASLSRGTAGVLSNTMICNLPGNPNGVSEIVPVLLPIVIHGIYDLKNDKQTRHREE
jgi:molybdopterin adenylyltransferase